MGVDISEKMLAVAMEEHPDIKFIHVDMSNLSFIKDRYDVVFSSLALHYIEDFDAFVKGVYDILTPERDIYNQKNRGKAGERNA